ncbi:MAG: serine/threonine-protein kinase [Cyanobacteria bacterium]|nr:serine/threonine-protein kinase [Cyanobacteriota bacterium]
MSDRPDPDDETLLITEQERSIVPLGQSLSRPSRTIDFFATIKDTVKEGSWRWTLPSLGFAIVAAAVTAWNPLILQSTDRDAQSLLQRAKVIQFPTPAPENMVIVAIDDDTLNQLKQIPPLKRRLYAQVLERLMAAGAKVVAVDIVFDLPSPDSVAIDNLAPDNLDCGSINQNNLSDDDRLLQQTINKYRDRLVLAAQYDIINTANWQQTQLTLPYCPFQAATIGTINFPTEADQRIHKFGNHLNLPNLQTTDDSLTFVDALLKKAGLLNNVNPNLQDIPFLGLPNQAFEGQTIPMWHILSDDNWNSDRLKKGAYFKDKLILIGSTATIQDDSLPTSVGQMFGIELHATATVGRLQNQDLRSALSLPWQNGVLVFFIVLLPLLLLSREQGDRRPLWMVPLRLSLTIGLWLCIGYGSLVIVRWHLPIVVPSLSLSLAGLLHPLVRLDTDRRTQWQLRSTLKRYGASPLVQQIIEQQEDPSLRNILQERQQELQGKQLGGRYEITKILGSGGFGETYTARDIQLPGKPVCVVKHLRPRSDSVNHLALARRLFEREALTLQELGRHDRIPQLLAFFEEGQEFYLIQQFIPGMPLSQTITLGRQLPEATVITILLELLTILNFVHHHQVIHRDIKPSNIIQRSNDQRLVLIDFGAVKALERLPDPDEPSDLTVGIGTQGYMAPEQQLGNPRPSSDLYGVGILAMQALTGLPVRQLLPDPDTNTIAWEAYATVSRPLAAIVNRLTAHNYKQRYQTATEALTALQNLMPDRALLPRLLNFDLDNTQDLDVSTQIWNPDSQAADSLPPTEQPPTDRIYEE